MRAQQLSVRRGTEVLFKPLDFEIQSGQLTWLRGANGSGKTSLLRVVAGLARADSGSLSWNGVALNASADYRSRLLYLGHANGLKDDLTAVESLQFLTALRGARPAPGQLQAALQRMGVAHRRKLSTRMLSQGQRRRVVLARLALETGPGFWVLDEPFDALDDAGVALVQELFQENVQRGGSVLFTSHIAIQSTATPIRELRLLGMKTR